MAEFEDDESLSNCTSPPKSLGFGVQEEAMALDVMRWMRETLQHRNLDLFNFHWPRLDHSLGHLFARVRACLRCIIRLGLWLGLGFLGKESPLKDEDPIQSRPNGKGNQEQRVFHFL